MAEALDEISAAAALLAEQHPGVAEYLLQYPGPLIEHLGGIENGMGRSARDTVILERRNMLLCQLGATASPVRLDAELRRYHTDVWLPRDRVKVTNPYPNTDRRATLWTLFQLWPRPVSLRYLRIILRRQP
jgi:hypothetical protein